MSETFRTSSAPLDTKLDNFPKYVRRQSLSRFLARYELFKMQLYITGSVVECGVQHGGGLLAWAKLSSALEPYNLQRRIVGFDTFEGFPSIHEKDTHGVRNVERQVGGFDVPHDVYGELTALIAEYDANRFLNQYEKVMLIKGDAVQTIPAFIEQHPYLLVSLLFMDFDLYAPTRTALETFLPRMGKGAILAFDEINNPRWPGETQALLETVNLKQYTINRFVMDPNIAYIVL